MSAHYEIERKFLLTQEHREKISLLNLPVIGGYMVSQSYLSVNPEIRIRQTFDMLESKVYYHMATKADLLYGPRGLIREEDEVLISQEEYEDLLANIKVPLIVKTVICYDYNGHEIEVNNVDQGMDTQFYYAEVEFDSEEEASNFQAPEWLGREVTDDPFYKMKNYWLRTRKND